MGFYVQGKQNGHIFILGIYRSHKCFKQEWRNSCAFFWKFAQQDIKSFLVLVLENTWFFFNLMNQMFWASLCYLFTCSEREGRTKRKKRWRRRNSRRRLKKIRSDERHRFVWKNFLHIPTKCANWKRSNLRTKPDLKTPQWKSVQGKIKAWKTTHNNPKQKSSKPIQL